MTQGLSACGIVTVSNGKPQEARAEISRKARFLLWGLVRVSGPVQVDYECPESWARIRNLWDVPDVALTVLTFGIYSQSTVEIQCRVSSVSL